MPSSINSSLHENKVTNKDVILIQSTRAMARHCDHTTTRRRWRKSSQTLISDFQTCWNFVRGTTSHEGSFVLGCLKLCIQYLPLVIDRVYT